MRASREYLQNEFASRFLISVGFMSFPSKERRSVILSEKSSVCLGTVKRVICRFLLKRNSVCGGSGFSSMKICRASTEFESTGSLKKIEIFKTSPDSSIFSPMTEKFSFRFGNLRPLKFMPRSGAPCIIGLRGRGCALTEKNSPKKRNISMKNKIVFFMGLVYHANRPFR